MSRLSEMDLRSEYSRFTSRFSTAPIDELVAQVVQLKVCIIHSPFQRFQKKKKHAPLTHKKIGVAQSFGFSSADAKERALAMGVLEHAAVLCIRKVWDGVSSPFFRPFLLFCPHTCSPSFVVLGGPCWV